jgi:WXXGXW repeat (2 copies)/Glycine-zipper domain
VGTGPNTQEGAVTGGALGALAGAILGNNSRSHNALAGALIGGTAGAIAGGTLGNAADQRNGTIYTSEQQATTNVVVQAPPRPPPPPTEVVVEQPAPDMIWIRGCWVWGPEGYFWAPGHWQRPPPYRRYYVAPHWQRRRGNYVYIQGYWH